MENITNTVENGFSQLGISSRLQALLQKRAFTVPTPIQHQAIPIAIKGDDVIGIAQTGTGKTLGFGIPMLDRLAKQPGIGLIIVPTRELALQVEESIRPFADAFQIRTAVLIGGASMNIQRQILQKKPRIVVATPGRLLDHMERFRFSLNGVSILVLDEADRMLDMGFAPQINRILDEVPEIRQTMLFSATMPSDIVTIAHKHMKSPTHIEVAPAGTANEMVEQELFFVRKDDKSKLLGSCLEAEKGSVLIFTRTKHGASKVNIMVKGFGHKAEEIHSNKSLAQRKRALSEFKSGKVRILVATDIAARGIDVKDIRLVINYDIPENPDDYVHRIGRTGRAGTTGKAITFATPDQARDVRDIERLVRNAIGLGELPAHIPNPNVKKLSTDGGGGGGRKFHYKDRNFGRTEGEGRRDFGRRRTHPYRAPAKQGDGTISSHKDTGGYMGRSSGMRSGGYAGKPSGGSSVRTGRGSTGRSGGYQTRDAVHGGRSSAYAGRSSSGRSSGASNTGSGYAGSRSGGYKGRSSGGTSTGYASKSSSRGGRMDGRSSVRPGGKPSFGGRSSGRSSSGGRPGGSRGRFAR